MYAEVFYTQKLKEDPTLTTVELMDMYAKSIIEDNFCDGSPIDFDECTIKQLKAIQERVNKLVEWVNK